MPTMPPRKRPRGETPASAVLGRFSTNNLKIGIIGLPEVGKSTFFNTLTHRFVEDSQSANNPAKDLEEYNKAIICFPDERFDWLCQKYNPKSKGRSLVEIYDPIRVAHQEQGLGDTFLSNIRAADVLFYVLRAFPHGFVADSQFVDPVKELEVISALLRQKDGEFIERRIKDLEEIRRSSNDRLLKMEHDLCLKVKELLETGKDVRLDEEWNVAEVELLNSLQLLTAKSVVYLVNVTKEEYKKQHNEFIGKIINWVGKHGGEQIISFSGEFETELADKTADEAAKYCTANKAESVLPEILKTGFSATNLIHFFTAGPDEVKCWQIRQQTRAFEAAGLIHTDVEKGFISAQVMKYQDLKAYGSESAVKEAQKYRRQAKTYVVQDGDIIDFLHWPPNKRHGN